MKTRVLARTSNVENATRLVEQLLSRQRDEQRGLALIHGLTGTGKTAFAERLGFTRGWLYYRMKKTETPKSFLTALYQRLNRRYYDDESVPRASTAKLEVLVTDILCEHPETVIIIDEINLATQFRRWNLMEIIRDLIDSSFATIIMVGEETTRKHLEGYNRHFFDRCGFFCEFKPNTASDYERFLADVSDVRMDGDIAKWLHQKTGGNLRQAGKAVPQLESLARQKGQKALTLKDIKGVS